MSIKYKTLRRVKKDYNEVFTKNNNTDEIHITVGTEDLHITTQQVGLPLNVPHVTIITTYCSYSMDWDMFIKKICS